MAQRRMFSPQIVESEEFLTMPVSSQALYFHLGMNADDDGFIQPKMVMRSVGSNEDDLKVLLTKRFLLPFQSGVVVIKHWLIHNLIQKDRYHPTRFQEEKKTLQIKDNRAYTDSVNKMLPEVRLGKVRLGEITSDKSDEDSEDITIETDEDLKPYKPFKRRAPDDNSRVIMEWAESRMQKKFPNPKKQMGCIRSMLDSKYTADEIKNKWEELEKDEFWNKKGIDFGIVLANIGRAKTVTSDYKSYK